ncbi:MAG TPA: signal peptidase I [Thermoanaerobaculia bacterium]|nr:signal peptidase I [Thermoanaerobaculia bacterium]
MEDVYQPPAARLETPAQPKVAPRRWWLAALLSFLFPLGLGQLYNGQWKKAMGVVLAIGVAVFAGWALVLWGPHPWLGLSLPSLVLVIALVEAAVTARRLGASYRLKACNRWYVYLAWCLLAYLGLQGVAAVWSTNVAQSFSMPSGSMEPTLRVGDHYCLEKWSPHEREVERGDIVVFQSVEQPGTSIISRVVGLPGDRLEIRDKQLYVNGQAREEPYAVHNDPTTYSADLSSVPGAAEAVKRDNMPPTVIPAGNYFVMGDNRDFSYDSRFWGPVPADNIVGGERLVIYWSRDLDRIGRVGD